MNYRKDPDARLDYTVDWRKWMPEGDAISTAVAIPDPGLTVQDVTWDDTSVTYWASGGSAGSSYKVVCRITTVAGRIDDRSDTIRVAER